MKNLVGKLHRYSLKNKKILTLKKLGISIFLYVIIYIVIYLLVFYFKNLRVDLSTMVPICILYINWF